jgi:hypothetical protein
MWAASEGILILLLVTILLGMVAAPAKGRSRIRSRRDEQINAKAPAMRMLSVPPDTLQKGSSNGVAPDYSTNQKVSVPFGLADKA